MPFCSGGEDVIALFSEVGEDFNYLVVRFAGAVDDLGEASTNLAVVVDAGEAQILKRQVSKLSNRLFNADAAGLNLLEKFS